MNQSKIWGVIGVKLWSLEIPNLVSIRDLCS